MTKTKLLTSTALVSAVALVGAAGANAATLKLGGFAELWVGWGDNDRAEAVDNNFDTKTDGEIYFRAEETLDNGIKAGVLFELEAFQGNAGGNGPGSASAGDGSDGYDESFGWVKTKWGQVNVGNNDLATGYVGGIKTVGPVGIIKSDAGDWIRGSGGTVLNNTDVDMGLGDSQNITYFTPRFMGAQLIVSFTPDASQQHEDDFDKNISGGLHNGISMALKYSGKFQGASFSLAGGRTTIENVDPQPGGDEREGYNAAGQVSVGAATLSAAWAREDVGGGAGTRNQNFWGIGGLYKINKTTTVSLAYGKGYNDSQLPGVFEAKTYVVTGGIEHKVGKGVSFAGSIFKVDKDVSGTANDRDGVGVVGGMVIKF